MRTGEPDARTIADGMARARLQADLLTRIVSAGTAGLSMAHERWRVILPLREKGLVSPMEADDGFSEHATPLGVDVASLLGKLHVPDHGRTSDAG